MLSIPSWGLLAAAGLIVYVFNLPVNRLQRETDCRHSKAACLMMVILGCVMRLFALSSLLPGLSAEEALIGVQAKALWQTGGFYPSGVLTTVLPQWTGETTGPLLAVFTAPFVGLFGLSLLTIRLPLVILSIASIPAAYVLGCALSGKKAGRFLMAVYALCPYFVLGARMTCGANAVLFMLPIAAALLVSGMKKPVFLYAGMAAMALTAYTQVMMLAIAPAAVIGAAIIALAYGKNRKHTLMASAMGVVLCVPAMLTVYVNMRGIDGFTFFDIIRIPGYGLFEKNLLEKLLTATRVKDFVLGVLSNVWRATVGGIFQAVWYENISASLFMPDGMLALTVISLPLMLLGAGVLVLRRIDGKKPEAEKAGPRAMLLMLFGIALAGVAIFGDKGCYDIGGAPDVFDHANLFFFAAVLMTAGWRQMQRRSMWGTRLLSGLMAVCVVWLGIHLFGGSYRENATTYFEGFVDAAAYAKEIQDETGAKVHVTSTVYPHVEPDVAAEIMYLYASDADIHEKQNFEVFYAPGIEIVDETQIYVVKTDDISGWYWENANYAEFGSFAVISPAGAQ